MQRSERGEALNEMATLYSDLEIRTKWPSRSGVSGGHRVATQHLPFGAGMGEIFGERIGCSIQHLPPKRGTGVAFVDEPSRPCAHGCSEGHPRPRCGALDGVRYVHAGRHHEAAMITPTSPPEGECEVAPSALPAAATP
jgi:hypothetical protein